MKGTGYFMGKKTDIEKISSDKEYEQLLQQIMERSKAGLEKAADEVRKATEKECAIPPSCNQ